MASEPQPGIEQELQDFARQRRAAAGGPLELQPETRELLQDEVSRAFGPAHPAATPVSPPPPRLNWLTGFWLRLAFAGAGLCIFILALISWLPREPVPNLQLATFTTESAPDQTAAIATVTVPQAPTAAEAAATDTSPRSLNTVAPPSPISTSPQTEPEHVSKPVDLTLSTIPERQKAETGLNAATRVAAVESKSTASSDPQRIASPQPATTSMEADKLALAKEVPLLEELADKDKSPAASNLEAQNRGAIALASTVDSSVITWSLTAVDSRARLRRNFNSPPLPRVLQSFRMTVSGGTVRLIDEDGSTYEGGFDSDGPLPSLASRGAEGASLLRKRGVAMDAAAGKPSELPAAFTVRGTHQTSKQPIVFTGRIASGPSDHAVPRTVSQTAMPSDILLSGQARVGATTLIPIQATSTPR